MSPLVGFGQCNATARIPSERKRNNKNETRNYVAGRFSLHHGGAVTRKQVHGAQFAERFKQARYASGLTLEAVAEKIGIAQQSVSGWEKGSVPRPQRWQAIADALSTTVDSLFFGTTSRTSGVSRDPDATLAQRLRAAMNRKSIHDAELARLVGISRASVSCWLNGKTRSLDGVNLLRAAKALDVSPEWLQGETLEVSPEPQGDDTSAKVGQVVAAFLSCDASDRHLLLRIAERLSRKAGTQRTGTS